MTEKRITNKQGGVKADGDKADWSLIDLSIIQEVAMVLTHGAKKYDRHNYDKVEPYRYFAATMRHLTAWQDGELTDKDSGLSHLAHAMTNLHILNRLDKKGLRYTKDD